MERIRDTAAVALIAIVSRLLRERPHLADGAAAIEQARSGVGDRAQAALSAALRQRAIADLAARLPITAISAAAVEVERRRDRRQTLVRALILAGVATALSFTVAALIQRRQAKRAPSPVPAERAVTAAPLKELVAIPIETPAAESQAEELTAALDPIEDPEQAEHELTERVRNEA
jgi:hypothetical protein